MEQKKFATIDGNEAAAYVMYRVNEVCGIYPITPSSPMAEWADEWAAKGIKNIWGNIPSIVEMESEGGAAGAVHGSLQAGTLTTTFTASQGLLLKIPNMFKIAGELTSTVFNITARAVATHALSIFGDHSDIMAARTTGFAFLAANSVQEAMDMALISQASTLESRVPFVHFFDGFRTSHEVAKIELLPESAMREMINDELVMAHKNRALNPDRPVIRGTAQNPDVFFQNREAANKYYEACPAIVQKNMDKFAKLTGRQYHIYEYYGPKDAERIIILMGSAVETAKDTVDYLSEHGEKVGILAVRLFRPFDIKAFCKEIPASCKKIAVLDRTKESGATGEPLYNDVVSALYEGQNNGYCNFKGMPKIIGGRYGLSSKDFTPAMLKAVFDNLNTETPKTHFTVGIDDDVTFTSLPVPENFDIESDNVVRALFYGLGSDGTVGANKNSIKIIGDDTPNYAQGYFEYDSKKAGGLTTSHLRFGPKPIRSAYFVSKANFIACHQTVFIEKYDMLRFLADGGTFLLNSPFPKEEVWAKFPKKMQEQIIAKKAKVYTIDAQKVAELSGMGRRINTVMQVCFFAISGVLPKDEAIDAIKKSIKKTYARKGEEVVAKNIKAVDNTLVNLFQVEIPAKATSTIAMHPPVPTDAPDFVKNVIGKMIENDGATLPVSVFPTDGTWPTGTTQYEKRAIALEIPVWDPKACIQCGKCSTVCPHAAIRPKVVEKNLLANAPTALKHVPSNDKSLAGMEFILQVSPEDCTGCGVCTEACPVKTKAIHLNSMFELREQESENWKFFMNLPDFDRTKIKTNMIKSQQLQRPLFEFSGSCAGCGETPYVKMLTQLFGDRALIANATGCSSIYGGNLPTTPYCKDANGRGPAWSNSLFEDNAEFGLGMRMAVDKNTEIARQLLGEMSDKFGKEFCDEILNAPQTNETEIAAQRARVAELNKKLENENSPEAVHLKTVASYLVKKSVWILGGDGWAYDIGYGGLDHVLSLGKNVNVLVLDTEVYSNTGGQSSKSTPIGAVAKFAANGKATAKKDLGMMAMAYKNVYVASISLGANDAQALKAFNEAEAYDGPSIIIAYSHCIAHGIDMSAPLSHQKAAVDSGRLILYRYNPSLASEGKNPLTVDSKAPKIPVIDFLKSENRFRQLEKSNPERADEFAKIAQQQIDERIKYFQYLAEEK